MIVCITVRLHFVRFTVNFARLHELIVVTAGDNLPAVHDDNFIRVLHGRNALRDNDFRRIGNFFRERAPNERVRFRIHRTRRIV